MLIGSLESQIRDRDRFKEIVFAFKEALQEIIHTTLDPASIAYNLTHQLHINTFAWITQLFGYTDGTHKDLI
jgi:hypothetical protein